MGAKDGRERKFKVVPLSGAYRRGRWQCTDFADQEIPLEIADSVALLMSDESKASSRCSEIQEIIDVEESTTLVVTSVIPHPPTPPSRSRIALDEDSKIEIGGTNSISPASNRASVDSHMVDESAPDSSDPTNDGTIDIKINQVLDLVKTHLTFAVNEEVERFKQKIAELKDKTKLLEAENEFLRKHAPQDVLDKLPLPPHCQIPVPIFRESK
ncbi:unnamed protein product, partial [Mesorhabditis belari]|uniref:Uncharacterized protein n=1 Tax=Mesorhabditis belari TaxID=2138241 RepID=A0AAF3EIA4_9BILA